MTSCKNRKTFDECTYKYLNQTNSKMPSKSRLKGKQIVNLFGISKLPWIELFPFVNVF